MKSTFFSQGPHGWSKHSTCHVCCVGLSPNGRLIDPILGPQHCGLDPQGLISLKNNSRKGHTEDKFDSKKGSKQHRSECVV